MMPTMKKIAAAMITTALLSGPALAADMILVVPVNITNLPPDVDSARISCVLRSDTGREMDRVMTRIPLQNGGHVGQVRVRFVPSGYPRGSDPVPDMASYSCRTVFEWVCTSSTSADGRCEYRPWTTEPTPADILFESPPGAAKLYDFEDEFDPDDAVELPRRFR